MEDEDIERLLMKQDEALALLERLRIAEPSGAKEQTDAGGGTSAAGPRPRA